MKPSVITSRMAARDFEKIKASHADLVTGISNQQMKVNAYRQQKAAEMQNQNVMQQEMETAKMTANSNDMKTALDFQQRQAELDVKRSALTS